MMHPKYADHAGNRGLGLPGRVAITGGGTGIGLACARLFHDAGAGVGLIGRSAARLKTAVEALGTDVADAFDGTVPAAGLSPTEATTLPPVVTAAASVTEDGDLAIAMTSIAEALGGLDALIVCAGVEGEMGVPVGEVTSAGFREVLETNVLGAFNAVKVALPHLKSSAHPSVTMIGSDSGFVAVPGMLAYNASKGALVQLVRALAVELHDDFGIRVNSVAPSIVDTPMARRGLGDEVMDAPDFPLQTPEDVAWSVAYLSSRQARTINGQTLLSDFGYTGRSSFPA